MTPSRESSAASAPPALQSLRRRVLEDERVRFLLVGGVNTAFAYALFSALVFALADAIHYTVLLVVTHVVTVLTSYVLHRAWVFHICGRFLRDLPRYWAVQLGVLGVNLVLLPLLVEVVVLHVLVAQALVVAVVAVVSWCGHRYLSFRHALADR